MPARAPIRTGIEENLSIYTEEVSGAIVTEAEGGAS